MKKFIPTLAVALILGSLVGLAVKPIGITITNGRTTNETQNTNYWRVADPNRVKSWYEIFFVDFLKKIASDNPQINRRLFKLGAFRYHFKSSFLKDLGHSDAANSLLPHQIEKQCWNSFVNLLQDEERFKKVVELRVRTSMLKACDTFSRSVQSSDYYKKTVKNPNQTVAKHKSREFLESIEIDFSIILDLDYKVSKPKKPAPKKPAPKKPAPKKPKE